MDVSIVISDSKWSTSFGLFAQVTISQPDFRTRFLVLGCLALAVQAFLPLLTDFLIYCLSKNRLSVSSA